MPSVTNKVSAVHLDTDHHDAFSRAIRAVLASNLAEVTMAQLVDGIPQADVAWEARGNLLTRAHPLSDHEQLCEDALEKTQHLRDNFDPDTLYFESSLMQAYSDAEIGSSDFKMRLVEMVAVSVHQIAVTLFNMSPKSHTPEHIKFVTEWQKPSGWVEYYGRRTWEEPLFSPPPTHFFHSAYLDFDLYPHGLADVAGYWAEDRILGGVVVFDRGQSGTECKHVFLHSGRDGETFRIWGLLESQLAALVDFLLGNIALGSFSLPLTATDENRYRFDPWDAIALHHIFRDPWERRIPLQKPLERDVRSAGDYPELQTLVDEIDEAIRKAEEISDEEAFTGLHDSRNTTSVKEQTAEPANPDRLWIYRHGGHVGEPLGSARLPWTGPPKEDGRAEKIPEDDGSNDDDYSEYSFGNGFRTPSPLRYDSENVQLDHEALLEETSVSLMSEGLSQDGIDSAGQNSTTNLRTGNDKRDDVQDMILTAVDSCGQSAEDASVEAGRVAIGGSPRPVTSRQPQNLSMKRKAEDDPSSG